MKTPIVVSKHQLFEFNPEFVSLLDNVNSGSNFRTKFNKRFNLQSRIINGGPETRL